MKFNLLTMIVLLIFVIFILRGFRKGFIKSLASMVSLVVSLILVSYVSPYVSDFLVKQTPVYRVISEKCEEAFKINDEMKPDAKTDSNQLIDKLNVPDILKNMLKQNNTQKTYKELAVKSFNEYVPMYMANLIMKIVTYIVSWILVGIALSIVVGLLNMIVKLPILNGINRLLGGCLGGIEGLVIVWIFFLIITIFSSTDIGKQLMRMVSENDLLKGLYNGNVLLHFLQKTVTSFM